MDGFIRGPFGRCGVLLDHELAGGLETSFANHIGLFVRRLVRHNGYL